MFDEYNNRRMWTDNPLAKTWEELGFNAYEARHCCFDSDGGDDGGGGGDSDAGDDTLTGGAGDDDLGGGWDMDPSYGSDLPGGMDMGGSGGGISTDTGGWSDDFGIDSNDSGSQGWNLDSNYGQDLPGAMTTGGSTSDINTASGDMWGGPPDFGTPIEITPSKLSYPLGLTEKQAKALGFGSGFGLRGEVEKGLRSKTDWSDSKINKAMSTIDVRTGTGPISMNPDISYNANQADKEEEEESWFDNLIEFFFGGTTTDKDQANKETTAGVKSAQDNITQTVEGLQAAMDLNSGLGSTEIADVFGQNPNRGKGSYDVNSGTLTSYGMSSGLIGSPATSVVAATVGLPLGVQVARGLLGAARAETPIDVISSAAGLATMVPNEAIAGMGALVGAGTGAVKGVDALGSFVEDELDISNPFSGLTDTLNQGLTNLGGSMGGYGTTGGTTSGGGVSGGLGGSDINTDVGGDDFTDPSITAPRSTDTQTTRTSTPLMETTVAENMPLSATTFGRRPGQDMPYGVVSPFMNVTDDLNSVSIGSTYGSPRAGRMRQAA